MKTKPSYPKTPQLDKMKAVHNKSQAIGEFITWLESKGMQIAQESEGERGLFSINDSIEKLLAKYFKIDLKKVEQEREAVLEYVRANQ